MYALSIVTLLCFSHIIKTPTHIAFSLCVRFGHIFSCFVCSKQYVLIQYWMDCARVCLAIIVNLQENLYCRHRTQCQCHRRRNRHTKRTRVSSILFPFVRFLLYPIASCFIAFVGFFNCFNFDFPFRWYLRCMILDTTQRSVQWIFFFLFFRSGNLFCRAHSMHARY